jgi:PKD domain-containing protein
MPANIVREAGEEALAERYRLRWLENAEHVPPFMAAAPPDRANNTWLIHYLPAIEQNLADLTAWVEEGVDPGHMSYEMVDGQIILPTSATDRGGIQPVINVTANGAERAEVSAGEEVTLVVNAAVPPGMGTIISLAWDFDGKGTYPRSEAVDGKSAEVEFTVGHTFDEPGTYFVTALTESHREGDVDAESRRVPNLAAARVVVR